MTIDFSNLKDLFIDGKKVYSLYFNGKKVKMAEQQPKDYLKLTSLAIGGSMALMKTGTPDEFSLEYSTDDGNSWNDYAAQQTIPLNEDKSVMFRRKGNATTVLSKDTNNYWYFVLNGTWKASGNAMSLLDASMESTTIGPSAFCRLFTGQTTLVDASELELPATTLGSSCYQYMFMNCTSLKEAPALPATTLADYCYNSMFRGCSSLASAPALPATTLASSCYDQMFYDCKSLSAAPALPATTLASSCYNSMFRGCSSLASAPALPATTLASSCYFGMFRDCKSLSAAPALPATTLASNCYWSMFVNCTSLASAPELQATTLADNCYSYMFYGSSSLSSMSVKFTVWSPSSATDNWLSGVAATGTFKCPEALGTDATIQRGASYCPTGWTVVNYDA